MESFTPTYRRRALRALAAVFISWAALFLLLRLPGLPAGMPQGIAYAAAAGLSAAALRWLPRLVHGDTPGTAAPSMRRSPAIRCLLCLCGTAVLWLIGFAAAQLFPPEVQPSAELTAAAVLRLVLLPAAAEEFIFRGLWLTLLSRASDAAPPEFRRRYAVGGTLLCALLFASVHAGLCGKVAAFFSGIVLTAVTVLCDPVPSGSRIRLPYAAIAAHALYNLGALLLAVPH